MLTQITLVDEDEARSYARARHAKSWVVLRLETTVHDAAPFVFDDAKMPTVYRLSKASLKTLALGVRVHDGMVYIDPEKACLS